MSNKANIQKEKSAAHNSVYLQAIFSRTSSQIFFLNSFTGSYKSHCEITTAVL